MSPPGTGPSSVPSRRSFPRAAHGCPGRAGVALPGLLWLRSHQCLQPRGAKKTPKHGSGGAGRGAQWTLYTGRFFPQRRRGWTKNHPPPGVRAACRPSPPSARLWRSTLRHQRTTRTGQGSGFAQTERFPFATTHSLSSWTLHLLERPFLWQTESLDFFRPIHSGSETTQHEGSPSTRTST